MVVAVIAFIVSVPVLSELMRVVPPRVSTSDSDLTTALASASRRAPDDSMACTKVGRPVGMDAIAVEMHSSTSVVVSMPRTRPKIAMMATAANAIMPNTLVMPSSSRCSGDLDRLVAVTSPAIWPIWVAVPVPVTTNVAEPRVTWVFWNTRLVRSPSATSPSGKVSGSLGTGALSPVSAASCTSSVAEDTIRPSAGTTSPASSSTTSPGTSLVESSCSTRPDRRTRACGTCSLASASTLAWAFSSWSEPITTLNVTSPSTTRAVAIWTMAKLAATTSSSMMFIGLTSWPRATVHILGGGSVGSAFGPYSSSRRSASWVSSPSSGLTPSCPATSCADSAYQARFSAGCCKVVISAPDLVRELDVLRPGIAEAFPSVVQGHAQHEDDRDRDDRGGLVDQGGEHERHEHRAGGHDGQDQDRELGAGLRTDPHVGRGDHGEDHQGHRAADRRDRVQLEPEGQDHAHRRRDQQPIGGPAAELARHQRRELSRLRQPLGQPRCRVQPGVRGAGGGEQRGDGHQPVA